MMIRFSTVAKCLAPIALLSLGACAAAPFRADVSRFQSQLPAPQGQTFAIKASDPANEGGIEFSQYAGLVAAEMQKIGYVPASGSAADMTVKLGYSVDKGKERSVGREDPFYDPFWGYGRYGGGFYGRPYVVQTRHGLRYVNGWYDPFLFGGYGFGYRGNDLDNYTVYTSGIDLTIERAADGNRLFEGKAEAKSRSNRLPYLVPNLVAAMFTDFPGGNGETVRISVAPEGKAK